jgi:hypothetical protein
MHVCRGSVISTYVFFFGLFLFFPLLLLFCAFVLVKRVLVGWLCFCVSIVFPFLASCSFLTCVKRERYSGAGLSFFCVFFFIFFFSSLPSPALVNHACKTCAINHLSCVKPLLTCMFSLLSFLFSCVSSSTPPAESKV